LHDGPTFGTSDDVVDGEPGDASLIGSGISLGLHGTPRTCRDDGTLRMLKIAG
jgi:hypothetical protein